MSSEGRLSPRRVKKLSKELGLDIYSAHAWWPAIEVITQADEHFWYYPRVGLVEPEENPTHYTDCPSRVERKAP